MAVSADARKLPCGCAFRIERCADAQLRIFVRRGLFCKAPCARETFIAKDQSHAKHLLKTRLTCARGLFHQGRDLFSCAADAPGADPDVFFTRRKPPVVRFQVPEEDDAAGQRKQRRVSGEHPIYRLEEDQPALGGCLDVEIRESDVLSVARSSCAAARVSGLFDSLRHNEQQSMHLRVAKPAPQTPEKHAAHSQVRKAAPQAHMLKAHRLPEKQVSEAAIVGKQQQLAAYDSMEPSFDDLSVEQKAAVSLVMRGESVFITGAAGTGKSLLLRYLVSKLRFEKGTARVAVTATTGAAAANIGGYTLHSFAGVGLGLKHRDRLLESVLGSPAREAWQMSRVLIIDEISMLQPSLFETLEYLARKVKGNELPFGGLQLILCGDFLQLPPVMHSVRFCFESSIWEACGLRRGTTFLTQVHRQAGDIEFIQILHEVRKGKCSEHMLARLHECLTERKALPPDGVLPTKLYCKNIDVDEENQQCLTALKGELQIYEARDVFRGTAEKNSSIRDWLLHSANKAVPVKLHLKEQAQVVLIRNLFGPLVNGTRGVVLSCGQRPVVQFDCGVTKVIEEQEWNLMSQGGSLVRMQLPLRLGWAITVHKSQGMSLSRAELSLQGAFDYGQVYVALSRVASMAGLWLRTKITQPMVRAHPKVLEYYFESPDQSHQLETAASADAAHHQPHCSNPRSEKGMKSMNSSSAVTSASEETAGATDTSASVPRIVKLQTLCDTFQGFASAPMSAEFQMAALELARAFHDAERHGHLQHPVTHLAGSLLHLWQKSRKLP